MAKLPQKMSLDQMQNTWATYLEPFIANPANNSLLLKNVSLTTGNNTVNHRLGRKLQGWAIVRKRSSADIYDTQDSNQLPELTLTLVSSANVTIDLMVF